MSLRRIKISRPGFSILSNPNSLSPKKKREHNNAWRQRQHDTKTDRLNCSHRSPRAFDSANLLLARSACIVGFLHVNRNARTPGYYGPRARRLCLERGVGFPYLALTNRHRDLARINAMSDQQSVASRIAAARRPASALPRCQARMTVQRDIGSRPGFEHWSKIFLAGPLDRIFD
jgi:hypothetical protein